MDALSQHLASHRRIGVMSIRLHTGVSLPSVMLLIFPMAGELKIRITLPLLKMACESGLRYALRLFLKPTR